MKKLVTPIALSIFLALSFISCQPESVAPTPNPSATSDTTCPEITINNVNPGNSFWQALPQTPGTGVWVNPTATAIDPVDGDVSSTITVSGSVDPNTAGYYQLVYKAHDPNNNYDSAYLNVAIGNPPNPNPPPFLDGIYQAIDTCQVDGSYTYTSTWSHHQNNEYYVNNFGGFGTSITITVLADTVQQTLSFQTPIVLGGASSLTYAAGSFTHSGPTVHATINYTWTDGTNSESCVSHYSK